MYKPFNSAFEGSPIENLSPLRGCQANETNNSRMKIMSLLKRIAELELRQGKYIEKVKYLEAVNKRLSCEHYEQLQLMSKHPTNQIEELIRTLQDQLRKTSERQSQASSLAKERELWFNKYNELLQSSSQNMDQEKQKRMEMEVQNKFLKQKLAETKDDADEIRKLQKENQELLSENQELLKQNEQLKRRKGDLEGQYGRLQQQIEVKFAYLQQQIGLYEAQKAQNMEKIRILQSELSIRESRHYFSFSRLNSQNCQDTSVHIGMQTDEIQSQLDLTVYKTSIQSLLEENNRLKRSLLLLQSLGLEGKTLPKQIEIEYQLGKSRSNQG